MHFLAEPKGETNSCFTFGYNTGWTKRRCGYVKKKEEKKERKKLIAESFLKVSKGVCRDSIDHVLLILSSFNVLCDHFNIL